MKVKNVDLKYYVFYYNFNKGLDTINILQGFNELIAANIRSSKGAYNHISDRDSLREFLEKEFMYHYWCKSECEYAIGSMWTKSIEELEKKDAWFQIEPNLDSITDYIIYKMDLKYN